MKRELIALCLLGALAGCNTPPPPPEEKDWDRWDYAENHAASSLTDNSSS